MAPEIHPTRPYTGGALAAPLAVRRFTLTVLEPAQARTSRESHGDRCSIGSEPSNDLVIDEQTVSRFHCEVIADDAGARVVDLGSRNGTSVDGVRVERAWLREGSVLRLGAAAVSFASTPESNLLATSDATEFHGIYGRSAAMRTVFSVLEQAAPTDSTVLVEGETGTGKGLAAEAIHRASARRSGPLVIIDCGAIPANLLENELFGHEKGAFTGADTRRVGAFEEASGGTVVLDEIGELPLELQPKLLRVLENRTVRRLGSNVMIPVDVRLIAATNRDLRADVNAGRFRADLYYRLAVIRVRLPALRQRAEDLPELSARILRSLGASEDKIADMLDLELFGALQRAAWPGNVRELRNYLERCLVFSQALPLAEAPAGDVFAPDATRPYADERLRALADFERRYIGELLARHGGNVTQAANAAGIARVHLHRLIRRHGLSR